MVSYRRVINDCCAPLVDQLRQVHSTVHLTGKPGDEVKVALQSLLEPPVPNVSIGPERSLRAWFLKVHCDLEHLPAQRRGSITAMW